MPIFFFLCHFSELKISELWEKILPNWKKFAACLSAVSHAEVLCEYYFQGTPYY